MTTRPRRATVAAAVLVLAAAVLPTAAWFVTGRAEVERRRTELVEEAVRTAAEGVANRAARLAARLDDLVARENERPFYHYRSLYHDPRGAAAGIAVVPSPLTAGVTDPFVWAHFEVDAEGRVSLPTVNERFPELSTDARFESFCTLLDELRTGMVVAGGADSDDRDVAAMASSEPRLVQPPWRIEILEGDAWEQIARADTLYDRLGRGDSRDTTGEPRETRSSSRVSVAVGHLAWHTFVLASGPTPAAVRRITTPDGPLVQGFVLAPRAILSSLVADDPSLAFVPESSTSSTAIAAPVGATGWVLSTDSTAILDRAAAQGREAWIAFLRTFATVAVAVLIAAAAAILILLETDHLARQRARFAAAAAHELKTPLATVRLHADMLAEGWADSESSRRWAERISVETARLGRLVANMLDLSRLERGAVLARPAPHDLDEVVTRCVDRVRGAAEASGLEIRLEASGPMPPVRLDPDALCQILDNLLDNAERYTRSAAVRRVDVRLEQAPGVARVVVADAGPGIPRDRRRTVFRPFRRGTAEGDGLGLGLAVARSLARAQGGDLRIVDSEAGATFVLDLPLADASGN